ncbi:MAG: insulinase family protein [Thiohalocapsa sp.]|jgi:zinc protease|uniref:M16 family metallopeptidase n=1 Tax=Thiohalocapsa sp. TaxID=2497641 RepID=UPI0025E5E627|nr:pitrilysin family protein [Thiohalocapsa sp.]MCG6942323.1 insulinase family protein [Thiohalocapsa sp.]
MSVDLKRLFVAAIVAAPALGLSLPAAATPQIQTWKTESGAKVLYAPAPDLPMVDVRVVFDAGSARDGDEPGLASMTAGMLTEGAGGLDADTIAERIESVGAQLGTGAGRDMAYASLRSLTEPEALGTALDVMTKVLAAPDFPQADLERVRANTLVALRQEEQDPGSVAGRALYHAVYGKHPYASDPEGNRDSVAAITRSDLVRFHQRYFTAPNATIAIVGAVDREQAEVIADLLTAGLPEGPPPAPLPPVPDLKAGAMERIDFPSSQTHVYMGQPGMRRGDPDYFPLYVGNHILGGSGLVSILMDEVRERRGLSYSAYSDFEPLAQRGPMVLGLQTKNASVDEALTVMRDVLDRFVREGPTQKELDAAVKNITGGFPLRIASNSNVVQYLAVIGFYDLPLDYLDRFNERVSAVTVDQIRDAFRRRVHPDRLAVVMVGGGAGGAPEQGAAAAQTAPSAMPDARPAGARALSAPAGGEG